MTECHQYVMQKPTTPYNNFVGDNRAKHMHPKIIKTLRVNVTSLMQKPTTPYNNVVGDNRAKHMHPKIIKTLRDCLSPIRNAKAHHSLQ